MGAMRARLTMKILSALVMLVLTVMTTRSCSGGPSKSSPLDPTNLLTNGVSSLCANQQAMAAASGAGTDSPQSLQLPAAQAGLAGAAQAAGLSAASLACPTTTTTTAGY